MKPKNEDILSKTKSGTDLTKTAFFIMKTQYNPMRMVGSMVMDDKFVNELREDLKEMERLSSKDLLNTTNASTDIELPSKPRYLYSEGDNVHLLRNGAPTTAKVTKANGKDLYVEYDQDGGGAWVAQDDIQGRVLAGGYPTREGSAPPDPANTEKTPMS